MRRVHFIGVCGTAMATVAAMLKRQGDQVSGSDQHMYPPMSTFLAREGVTVYEGYRAEQVTSDLDLVVIGNAVSRGNPEVEEVLDRKVRYCSLPELVRDRFLWGAKSIVVAGTHGKTTTTSLLAWLLTRGGLDPGLLVGGISANFDSSYRLGGGRPFVIEGDEYDSAFFDKTAKFLKYLPDIAVIGNVEFDHADIYPDLDAVKLAFRRLVTLVPRRGLLLLGADSEHAAALAGGAPCPVETFGVSPGATWHAADVEMGDRGMRFALYYQSRLFGAFEVPLLGLHNVRNAVAAIAVGRALGLDATTLQEGLEGFLGVKRRLELRGEARGVRVYDDFAHHPTAVAETIAALKLGHPTQRMWAVFEPRSATSCLRTFQSDFVSALAGADRVILAPVFRTKVPEHERLDPHAVVAALAERGADAQVAPSTAAIVETLARDTRPGDLVVFMSNGGFDAVHDRLLEALRTGDGATD